MKHNLLCALLIFTLTGLISTSANAANVPPLLYTVKATPVNQTLYYDGTISPIKNVPVVSPTQGVIDEMHFSYGEIVKKDQLLFHVQSDKVMNDLRDANAAYLTAQEGFNKKKNFESSDAYISAQDNLAKAKRALQQAKTTYDENQKLYELQIISHDELVQSENAYEDSQTSLAQSQRSLDDLIAQSKGTELTISQLQLTNAQEKYDSLSQQVKDNNIAAPAEGIVLVPDTDSNASAASGNSSGQSTTSGKLQVGSTISYQQVLLNIGDMSGLKIDFTVPEININQIAINQKASITGAGFPGITLNGLVTSVGAQASADGGGGGGSLPSFPVEVTVPSITKEQQTLIKSGMDAQVAITVSQNVALTVPVGAVTQNAEKQSVVKLYNPSTKATVTTVVTTGKVMANSVEILSGVKAGDQIVLPH